MLEERNQRRCNRDNLLWRDVHVFNARRLNKLKALALTAIDALANKSTIGIKLGVRLRNCVALLFVGRKIDDLVRDASILHATVWGLDEAKVVNATERRERADEADVRAFWRFDWADTTVVAMVHVAHVEAGALAREAAWAKR